VRLLPRWRLDHSFRTASWSSGLSSRTRGERSAATATDRASFASFLFAFPAASSRTRAPSLGDWRTSQNWLDVVELPVGYGAAAAVPLQVDSAGTGPGWLGAGP
jgi:hypothetical protein